MIDFLIMIGTIVVLALAVFAFAWKSSKPIVREHTRREQLALRASPTYQAMLDSEHRRTLDLERLAMERERLAMEWYALRHRASPETYIIDEEPITITALPSLKRPALPEPSQEVIISPDVQQPAQEWLIAALSSEENRLIVSPGLRASTGEVVKVSIVDVPHLKIIGSTGFGKSCLAGAVLDQATQLNSPDILQLALLDLEHKTSRLFEHLPHVADLRIGSRMVTMVATNADEVAEHLGILKKELDRRAALSESELERQPVLLMYVEEMLSLGYEVVDPKLLKRMFADLTILAVRGRKYGMFLLACMQTDYSTDEMKVTQKMFRFRSAAAIDTTAAKAAGFMNAELIKANFAKGKPGQFVVEYPSFSDIVLAPIYDVKRLVAAKSRQSENVIPFPERRMKDTDTVVESDLKNTGETNTDAVSQSLFQAHFSEVLALREKGWGKVAIVEKVWRVKAGGTVAYQRACVEYEQIVSGLEENAQ